MLQHALEGKLEDWPNELRGPKIKVERAMEHASVFGEEVDAFLASRPYEIVSEFEAAAGCFELKVKVHQEPPPRLSAIIGDVIHNARSALDHIAWALAARHLGRAEAQLRRTQISFPVCLKRRDFRKRTQGLFNHEAVAILEALQPYNRMPSHPEQDVFAVLTELWNVDKHRSVHLSLSALDITKMKFRPAAVDLAQLDPVRVERQRRDGDEVEDGTPLVRVWFPTPDPIGTKIEITEQPAVSVVFGGVGIGPKSASALVRETGQVFGYFLPLFATA